MSAVSDPATNAIVRESRSSTALLPAALDASRSSALQAALNAFVQNSPVKGAQVAVVKPGQWSWSAASGTTETGKALNANDAFLIDSTTKTFTATLVFRAADAGQLDLDARLPALTKLPGFTYATQLTARQLLEHRTGLRSYRDATLYRAHRDRMTSPGAVLMAVQQDPLDFAPGTKQSYSSTNYLVLGLLLEQITGRGYEQLLNNELLEPLGLTATHMNPSLPGEPRFSTGGLTSTTHDLAIWATALIRNRELLSERSMQSMLQVNPATGIGAGINGFCPCTQNSDGTTTPGAFGFNAVTTFFQFSPQHDTVVVVNTVVPFVLNESVYTELNALFVALFGAADGIG